jgi:hypothetical protein
LIAGRMKKYVHLQNRHDRRTSLLVQEQTYFADGKPLCFYYKLENKRY